MIAIMGGIYLGSTAIVFIFVCILLANTLLIYQVARMKNCYLNRAMP
ncbi:MAG TPA: hypothetical protein VNJ07_13910 [Chitinophagales bacterium]|nr:hypothetical protein [Chitinophagales bacterium]